MSCPRYESVASRRVASMKFRREHIGGVSPFGGHSISFTASHHGVIIETSAQRRPASWRRPVEENKSGKLTTVSCSCFLKTRIMGFFSANSDETDRGGKKGRRRARSAEIVYFSLAKRRKIKGKQETTARDGGNQAGLRSGMDFPRANAGHRAAGWLIVVQERGIPHGWPIETSQWPARSLAWLYSWFPFGFLSDFTRPNTGALSLSLSLFSGFYRKKD